MGKRIKFFVGSGRCGTKSIAEFYKKIKGHYSVHEPHPKLKEEYLQVLFNPSNYKLVFKSLLEKQKIIETILDHYEVYVESNPRLTPFIDLLDDYFNCEIRYIVRDGRDWVRSSFGRKFVTDVLPEPLEKIFPKGNYDKFDRLCWLWSLVVNVGMNKYKATGRSHIDKIEILGEVLGKHNATDKYVLPHWSNWSDEQKDKAKKWMNNTLIKLNYVKDGNW